MIFGLRDRRLTTWPPRLRIHQNQSWKKVYFSFTCLLRFGMSSFTVLLLSRIFLAGVDDLKCPFPNVTICIICKSHDISTRDLHRDSHQDLARREWGLNPWSSVYENDALPLGHHAAWIRICALYKILTFLIPWGSTCLHSHYCYCIGLPLLKVMASIVHSQL